MTKSEKRTAVILLLMVIIFSIIITEYTEKAVQTCISNGVDPNICAELRD